VNVLESVIAGISPQDGDARLRATARLKQLTMPRWALGRLMDLAVDLAGMTGLLAPPIARKTVVTMAGDHGIARAGVSLYPQEVTLQMVHNFVRGGAGINVLARLAGARVVVVDMGVAGDLADFAREGKILSRRVAAGTRNFAEGPAMSREEAVQSVMGGIETALELGPDTDLFATGDMGIGNTTSSSAVVALFSGAPVAEVTGWRYRPRRGAALPQGRGDRKGPRPEPPRPQGSPRCPGKGRGVRDRRHSRPDPRRRFDEKAGPGGRFHFHGRALIAARLAPLSCDYMVASHRSMEQGHRIALECLGKKPLLDLDLRLGEGTGAALAMHLVEAAVRVMTETASFEEASVSQAQT